MIRFVGVVTVIAVILLAMAFAAGNAGNDVNLNLFLFTLYRVPVTLVAFAGLFTGMVIMFATGVHSDLKVRRILRERLAEESRQEQEWIDRDQRDLFADQSDAGIPMALELGERIQTGEDQPGGQEAESLAEGEGEASSVPEFEESGGRLDDPEPEGEDRFPKPYDG